MFQDHLLQASALYQYTTNVMIRNSSFQDCYISFMNTKAVLEGIDAYNSQLLFISNSTILCKDSKLIGSSQSAIEVTYSNITFSGKLSFCSNMEEPY